LQDRHQSRITYPIHVRGKDTLGRRFTEDTTVSDPGTSSFYFQINSKAYQGTKLLIIIWLPAVGRLALRCVVRRVDARTDGTYGVVAKIIRYRSI
jgi:hypothetical protein